MSGTTNNKRVASALATAAAPDSMATGNVEQASAMLETALRMLADARLAPTGPVANQPFLTTEELAQHFSVQPSWVYRKVQQDASFPFHRFGKYLRFKVSEVEAWAARQRETVAEGRR